MATALSGSRQRAAGGGASPHDGTVDLARDRELVERCQAGDRSAFEELYRRYHRRLFHFCLRRLHRTAEAEDAVQEAFTRAWRALPGFAGERRFYPWLTVIAGNICTDTLRRQSRQFPVDEVPLPHADVSVHDVDEALLQEVDAATVLQALERLSDRHQRVLQLREASGWSTQRIAEHEGVAVPAAETLLWRARQALKREFAALAETGVRLGAVIGLGVAGARRLLDRSAARVAARIPVVRTLAMDRPRIMASSVILTAGIVGGAVMLTTPPAAQSTSTLLPPAQPGATSAPATLLPGANAAPGSSGHAAAGAVPFPAAGTGAPASGAAAHGGSGAPAVPHAAAVLPTGSSPLPAGITSPLGLGSPLATGLGPTVTSLTHGLGVTVPPLSGPLGSTVTSLGHGVGSTVTSLGHSVGSTVTSLGQGVGSTVTSLAGSLGSTSPNGTTTTPRPTGTVSLP